MAAPGPRQRAMRARSEMNACFFNPSRSEWESVADHEANFHMVVDDYIAACESLGGVPEKPASGKLMLRVAPGVHAAALKAAARRGISLDKWAEEVLGVASRRSATARTPQANPDRSRRPAHAGPRSSRAA